MFKYINIKKLINKNNKFKFKKLLKSLTLVAALSATLVGCSPTKNKNAEKAKYNKYSAEEWDSFKDVDVDIIYNNWNDDIQKEERIYFTYDGTAYNALTIRGDGTNNTQIKNIDGYIYSSYLEKEIDIPKANEDEKIVVNVDYKDRTLEAHTEKLEFDKAK